MDIFMTNYFSWSHTVTSGESVQEQTVFCDWIKYMNKKVCPVHIQFKVTVWCALSKGCHLPMIPRAMPAGAQAPGRATQAGKVKDEGRN
jgi:hypothetical protein